MVFFYYGMIVAAVVLVVRRRGAQIGWASGAFVLSGTWAFFAIAPVLRGSAFFVVPLLISAFWFLTGIVLRTTAQGSGSALLMLFLVWLILSPVETAMFVFSSVALAFALVAWIRLLLARRAGKTSS